MSAACPVFGFALALHVTAGVEDPATTPLARRLHEELADAHGLAWTGVRRADRWHLTFVREGGQATEADRELVRAWAEAQPEILRVEMGPLVDVEGGE